MAERSTYQGALWSNAIDRHYQLAPYFPRCSFTKNAMLSRPRELAVHQPYMQFNSPSMYAWMVFDLDDVPDGYSWDEAGVPPPNLVVRSRTEPSQHWYYAISPVTRGQRAREHPIAYMKAVYSAMAERIAPADLNYSNGPVARTPGHRLWHTIEIHSHEYSLGELADYAEPQSPRSTSSNIDDDTQGSRHLWLFHYLRKAIAYPTVDRFREHGDYTEFLRHIQAAAAGVNTFSQRGWGKSNLSSAQVRAVCKSIARWTWTRYRGQSNGCARGIMALDVTLPLQVRQSLSARRTHSQRTIHTRRKIVAAVRSLVAQGKTLTMTAIAAEAGVVRQTVAAHRDAINVSASRDAAPSVTSSTSDTDSAKPSRSAPTVRVVNFGADKITSRFRNQSSVFRGNVIGLRATSSSSDKCNGSTSATLNSGEAWKSSGGSEPKGKNKPP